MHITSFGNSFIKLNIKSPHLGDSVLFIDPFATKTWGMRQPKMEADLILQTEKDISKGVPLPKETLVINEPGEYEHREVYVLGATSQQPDSKKNLTYYLIEAEGMTLVHLGATKQTSFSDQEREILEGADILFVPIGDNGSLSGKQAAALVQQFEPRVVIPIYYKYPGAKTKLADQKEFLKELGNPKTEDTTKLSIKKKELPTDETKIIFIHP